MERSAVLQGQKKIVLRNCGFINPDDIEEYIGRRRLPGAVQGADRGRPETVIEQVKASKLRGRGGAGYLTGNKWEFLAKAKADQKYIICNADEGDPGAYMNRNEIESDPHSLLEGHDHRRLRDGRHRRHRVRARGVSAGGAPADTGHRAGARVRHAGREHPGPRVQVQHRAGGRRRRLCVRRRDGADRVAGRHGRTAAAAAAVSGAEGAVGQANQHQQRRDLVQHRAHRHQRPGMVHRDRQLRRARGRRSSRWWARCTARDWWRCRWGRR